MTPYIAATTLEPSRGWGGPLAILIAVAVFVAIATVHHNITEARARRPHSPAGRGARVVGVKPLVSSVSDTSDTDADTGWWGRIVELGGHRVRQIEDGHQPADDDIDLALDGGDESETLEEFIARADDAGVPYAEIVRDAVRAFRVSESTAKRRIRDVRADREGSGAA